MKLNWKTIGIGFILLIWGGSIFIVWNNQQGKIKAIQMELDMNRAELGTFKNRAHEEREMNNDFGNMVRELRDSIDLLEFNSNQKSETILKLQQEKNEILRKDYSKHTDADLSKMLLDLFSEQDSMP
jgi:uncharacterized membrane-anchored protein YhcB (DUF1043 family)